MNATKQAGQLAAELLDGSSQNDRDPTAVRRRMWLIDAIAVEEHPEMYVHTTPADPRSMDR